MSAKGKSWVDALVIASVLFGTAQLASQSHRRADLAQAGHLESLPLEQMAKIARLKGYLLQPFSEVRHDPVKSAQHSKAIRALAFMQRPESIEALISIFYAEPISDYFVSTAQVVSTSHNAMHMLDLVLEGVPKPADGDILYKPSDVPHFRVWWEANRNNLRFKHLPEKPEIYFDP